MDYKTNMFLVGANVNGIVSIVRPPRGDMTTEEAINLAAWILVVADPMREELDKALEAIEG